MACVWCFLDQDEFERVRKGLAIHPVRDPRAGARPTERNGLLFNVVFRPDDGQTPWVARHNLTGVQHQAPNSTSGLKAVNPTAPIQQAIPRRTASAGMRLRHKHRGPPFLAYHARSEGIPPSPGSTKCHRPGMVPVTLGRPVGRSALLHRAL